MRWSGFLAALLLPLAGCAAPDAPVAEADNVILAPSSGAAPPSSSSAPPAPGPSPSAPPSAPPSSPTPESPQDPEAPEPEEEEAPDGPPRPEVVPFSYSGWLDARACVPLGTGGCVFFQVLSSDEFHLVEETRAPVGFEFELTWDAVSPLTEGLVVWADHVTSCGDGCWNFEDAATVEGTSPLRIEVEDSRGMGDGPLGIWIRMPSQTPSPLYGWARTDQEFTVTGTATYLV